MKRRRCTLKALIQETKPSIYLLVSDDIVDSSNEDEPMVSCSVQWVTRETDGALLYTSWAEAEAVLRELDTLSVVGALMRRLYDKLGTVDNDIETFENPCLLVQTLALELCEDVVWKLYSNQMDNTGTIPPEAWEYLQATFDRAVEETNLFENLWSNL